MARRISERPSPLTEAFRVACEVAGLTQEQLAERLGVHQTTVSKWLVGKAQPPLEHLPIVDALCGERRGHILRLAGFVDDGVDVVAAINQDPALDEDSKAAMLLSYRTFVRLSHPSATA